MKLLPSWVSRISFAEMIRRIFGRNAVVPKIAIVAPETGVSGIENIEVNAYGFEKKNSEDVGQFYFRGDILDKLDRYFSHIKQMKKSDPDAYDLYKKVGAAVVPEKMLFHETTELTPLWRAGEMPGFGAVSLVGAKNESDKNFHAIRFLYFLKLKSSPQHVQAAHGTAFECTAFFDDERHGGLPIRFYCCVKPDHCVVLLKQKNQKWRRIKSKRPGDRSFDLVQMEWSYPTVLHDWVASHKKDRGVDIQKFCTSLFCMAAEAIENVNSGIRIAATKAGTTAVFSVDTKRTPYFFKDREVTINESGRKRKIFHIVRAHKRVRRDGIEGYVKFHFRGERMFVWNGFDINISMPGFHHADILKFKAGSSILPQNEILDGMITTKELGKRLSQELRK